MAQKTAPPPRQAAKPVAPVPKKPAPTAMVRKDKNMHLAKATPLADQFLADAGQGLENTRAEDFALPFISLLQDLNPEVKKRDEKYIEGAEAGMFMNTVTKELLHELRVIPVDFSKVYNEWVPRDVGGGFVKSWDDKSDAERGKRDDTQIVDTANHYILVQNANGEWEQAILSLTSTKLKASRNWLSRIAGVMIDGPGGAKVPAPSFARTYLIKSIVQTNQHGTFFNLQIDPEMDTDGDPVWVADPAVYNQAKAFRALIKAGQRGADFKVEDAELVNDDTPGTNKF